MMSAARTTLPTDMFRSVVKVDVHYTHDDEPYVVLTTEDHTVVWKSSPGIPECTDESSDLFEMLDAAGLNPWRWARSDEFHAIQEMGFNDNMNSIREMAMLASMIIGPEKAREMVSEAFEYAELMEGVPSFIEDKDDEEEH